MEDDASDFDTRIGKAIVSRRVALGMRQGDLSEALRGRGVNWSQGTLSKVEMGTRPVRFSEAHALAAALGTTPDQLADVQSVAAQSDAADAILDSAIRALQELKGSA